MKSQADVLLHVVTGLLKDCQLAYPEYLGVALDKKRIALLVESRGLTLFTLDLPCLNDLLLDGLETGRLKLEGPLSKRVSKRILVPRLFSGLWLRIFRQDSSLRPDVDPTAIAFLRQLTCLGKKIEVACSESRVKAALRNYHEIERAVRRPTLNWASDQLDHDKLANLCLSDIVHQRNRLDLFPQGADPSERGLLDRCQQVADAILMPLPFFEPVSYSRELEADGLGIGFRHGPGAVAERLKSHEKSDFKSWPDKLEDWFPYEQCGLTSTSTFRNPVNHEPPSRLIQVPKTAKGPRLIASEPVAHQWCQQIIWKWLDTEFKRAYKGNFINFRRQDQSGDMVLSASLDRKFATVDLSDASDRLSCWTIERMFRTKPSLLCALHAARTRWIRDDISGPQSLFIKLNKFASQGTATTFPIQSIVYLIISLTASLGGGKVTPERIWKLRNQVRVYGDDIIIPTHGYGQLLKLMDLLGLRVNKRKSYVLGNFRESCGTDGFMGHCVTPVKPKTVIADSPEATQAVIDTTNNLFNKGYWHASEQLRLTIPVRFSRGLRIVGPAASGRVGLVSFVGSDERHLRTRWNSSLHRYEVRVLGVRQKQGLRDRQDCGQLLDFFRAGYNPWYPRIVSQFVNSRKASIGLLWEPLNHDSHGASALGIPNRIRTTRNGPMGTVRSR
jgi:hypothetical protein